VDLSASMKGYSRQRGSALLGFAEGIKEALYLEGIHEIHGAGFGKALEPTRPLNGIVETLSWPAVQADTCLPLPLLHELGAAADAAEPPLLLILTDGVASVTSKACGSSCAQGSDMTCVSDALQEFLRAGNALWVIGLRVPFSGRYYPETGSKRILEVRQSTSRPIYLWMGSPDLAAGRRIAANLAAWAAARSLDVLAVEAWPGRWQGSGPAQPSGGRWQRGAFRASEALTQSCSAKDQLALHGFDPQRVPAEIRLQALRPGARPGGVWAGAAPVKATADAPPEGIASLLELHSDPLPLLAGGEFLRPPAARNGHLDMCLRLSAPAGRIELAWSARADASVLRHWSTEDDSSLATLDRTLNLERLWGLLGERLQREAASSLRTPVLLLELVPPLAGD
jgi:hypothetical protein